MSGTFDDAKKRILGRVGLASLIGETVSLRPQAGRHLGLCPFHQESSPSFNVYDDHYYCYGCQRHGDAITFVRETQGLGFVDALRFLAGKHGIEAPELDEARGRLGRQREDAALYRMMAEAQEWFVANLHGAGGAAARAYLEGRGFTPENIKTFGFGLAPVDNYGLVRHLRAKDYRDADLIACSLASASTRDGRAYDFFRGRVMLPIRDRQGRIVAFGGRTLGDDPRKYLNSGATKLFDKSVTLFGFDKARTVMRRRAIVVEGYMDALQLWQHGFPEAVACLGTAFTEWHMRLLAEATSQVVLLFDGDGAGKKATLEAVGVALTQPRVEVRAAVIAGAKDPDELLRQGGAAAMDKILEGSTKILDFVIQEKLKTTHALGVPELVSREFVPWLARVPERMQRDFLITRIAHLTGIPATQIAGGLTGAPSPEVQGALRERRAAATDTRTVPQRATPPLAPLAYDLFGHVFHGEPAEVDTASLRGIATGELELAPEHQAFLDELLACHEQGAAPASRSLGDWVASLDPALLPLLERLAAADRAFACNDRRERLAKVISHLRARKTKETVTRLKAELTRKAAVPGNEVEVTQLMKTIMELTRKGSVGSV